ncbi:MAG: hypothetical protein QG573_2205 [Acidobacteriota bacterium]|nr:hypothetical protein [Acidobacteriota bacterium]
MTKTILLADDSVTIQKVVELTFMDEDFRVSAVSNGAEAIAQLSESKPDVVIADVHMPGAGGFEVCRRSKELYPAVPVLLLVGTFEGFDADEAVRCGADGHLKKPFDSQELMRRIRELASAPSRSTPVPPASTEFALLDPAGLSGAGVLPPADDIYALPEPAGELWEPSADDLPALDSAEPEPSPAPTVHETPQMEPDARFPPFAGAAAPVAMPLAFPIEAEPVAQRSESSGSGASLSDADVDRIARRMLELVGDKAVRDVAWEVVPDLAEVLLKSRIRELESSID